MFTKSIVLAALSLFLIAGCNSDSDSDSEVDIADVELTGHWRLTGTGFSYDVIVDDDKRFVAYNGTGAILGTTSDSIYKSGSSVLGGGIFCSVSDDVCDDISIDFDAEATDRLDGTVTGLSGAEDAAQLQSATSLEKQVSISDIANKTWVDNANSNSTLMIYSDGSFQGTDENNNAFSGSVKDTGDNAFTISGQFEINSVTVTIPGLFYIDSNDQLVAAGATKGGGGYYVFYGVYSVSR